MGASDAQVLVKITAVGADTSPVIEGGVAGGSALALASQRRSTAERLVTEALWLERVAGDERAMAALLDYLPPSYAILHDLKMPGSKGNIDHLVVGPGGAFLVVTRRYMDAISYRDGQLWAGQTSLRGDLDTARVESQFASQTMGTPVVPVLSFMDSVMPAAAPRAIDGVLVTSSDNACRVVTRASHTLLTSPQVADVVERALPLLHSPGTVVRVVSAKGVPRDPDPDPSVHPTMPPRDQPSSQVPAVPAKEDRRAARRAAKEQRRAERTPEKDTNELAALPSTQAPTQAPSQAAAYSPTPDATIAQPAVGERPPRVWLRTLRTVGLAVLVLSIAAVAVGTLGRYVWSEFVEAEPGSTEPAGSGATTTVDPAASTTVPGAGGTVPTDGSGEFSVPAPIYAPYCPAAGAGWALIPAWPGSHPAVAYYDVEVGQLDGTWVPHASLTGPATIGDPPEKVAGVISGQPSGATYTLRLVAVGSDGARTPGEAVTVTAPVGPC